MPKRRIHSPRLLFASAGFTLRWLAVLVKGDFCMFLIVHRKDHSPSLFMLDTDRIVSVEPSGDGSQIKLEDDQVIWCTENLQQIAVALGSSYRVQFSDGLSQEEADRRFQTGSSKTTRLPTDPDVGPVVSLTLKAGYGIELPVRAVKSFGMSPSYGVEVIMDDGTIRRPTESLMFVVNALLQAAIKDAQDALSKAGKCGFGKLAPVVKMTELMTTSGDPVLFDVTEVGGINAAKDGTAEVLLGLARVVKTRNPFEETARRLFASAKAVPAQIELDRQA